MPRSNNAQLSVRSNFAKQRVEYLTRETGMNATQIVEEALRAYIPPPPAQVSDEELPPGLIRKGNLLVFARRPGEPMLTIAEVQADIDDAREERADMVERPWLYEDEPWQYQGE